MSFSLENARKVALALNDKLKPIASRSVNVNDPKWVSLLRELSPLDEVGVRSEAQLLITSLLDAYSSGTSSQRASIREIFRQCSAFAWATGAPEPPITAKGFRQHLLRLSAIDQAQDIRDAILDLNELCAKAKAAGVEIEPILSEVAALSNEEGGSMGSFSSILRNAR